MGRLLHCPNAHRTGHPPTPRAQRRGTEHRRAGRRAGRPRAGGDGVVRRAGGGPAGCRLPGRRAGGRSAEEPADLGGVRGGGAGRGAAAADRPGAVDGPGRHVRHLPAARRDGRRDLRPLRGHPAGLAGRAAGPAAGADGPLDPGPPPPGAGVLRPPTVAADGADLALRRPPALALLRSGGRLHPGDLRGGAGRRPSRPSSGGRGGPRSAPPWVSPTMRCCWPSSPSSFARRGWVT